MKAIAFSRPLCAALVALFALAACAKFESGQNEMNWARAALERNGRLEVVASDAQASTFTVRMKDTGELRVVRLDQVVAGPPSGAGAAASTTGDAASVGATTTAQAAAAPSDASTQSAADTANPAPTSTAEPPAPGARPTQGTLATQGEPATAASQAPAEAPQTSTETTQGPRSESASGANPGHLLASGPGYTIKAADSRGAAARRTTNSGPSSGASVERRHDPIICQGERFLQIDNRNLEFDGDAVSAQDGCEIHITNSRISAKGVGVSARKANVHIENSQIEGDSGSVNASEGAQVYSASSTFKGLRRREDNAAFHDLGGNVWN